MESLPRWEHYGSMAASTIRRAIAAAFLAAPLAAAAAEGVIPEHPALLDRFWVGAGAFFPQTTTSAQLQNTQTGVGANVDFENALGMATDKSVPMLSGRWRLGQRWRVEFEYFQLNRTGTKVVDRDIQWGDTTYPINASVSSKFNFSDLRVSAGYAFFKRPDKEVGVGFGLHLAQYDVSLQANGLATESSSVSAPLPVLSVYSQIALTERWALAARMDRFVLKYDTFDGSITGMGLDVMYQPFRHVGFGLGTRALYIDASADKNNRKAEFRQTFQGPLLFMNVSF
jgi:hypothetical protein